MFANSQDIFANNSEGFPDKSSSVSTTNFTDSSYHPTQSQVSNSSEDSDFLDDEPTGTWWTAEL